MTVTLLTGASSGIGRSLARRLADDPLALVARRKALLDTLAAEIEAAGGQALALPCDVTDRAQVAAAVPGHRGALRPDRAADRERRRRQRARTSSASPRPGSRRFCG